VKALASLAMGVISVRGGNSVTDACRHASGKEKAAQCAMDREPSGGAQLALPWVRRSFMPVQGWERSDTVAEETSREVDLEVKKLMTEADETASIILREHRKTLEAVVRLLLEREVVEGDEVRRLLAAEIPQALRAISA